MHPVFIRKAHWVWGQRAADNSLHFYAQLDQSVGKSRDLEKILGYWDTGKLSRFDPQKDKVMSDKGRDEKHLRAKNWF